MYGKVKLPEKATEDCALCVHAGGRVVWKDDDWRVIAVDDADFPVFYRVVSCAHVEEFSMLSPRQRVRCIELVCAVETALLECVRPTSINLAALGNLVPHLHWHVIARFDWDSHFPGSVWGARQRTVIPSAVDRLRHSRFRLDDIVRAALDNTSDRP